jgi:hypothetical protein
MTMDEHEDPQAQPLPSVEPPHELRRIFDDEGRLTMWPAKLKKKLLALEWIAEHFEFDREYTEREVNDLLNRLHTFEDWAILRRELYDRRFFGRESDGSRYWRRRD